MPANVTLSDGSNKHDSPKRPRLLLLLDHLNKNIEILKNWVQVFAGLGVFITVAALSFQAWQWWYSTYREPKKRPPYVTITTSLEESGRQDSLIALTSTVTIENNSKTRVRILGASYNIEGGEIDPFSIGATDSEYVSQFAELQGIFAADTMDAINIRVSRFLNGSRWMVVQSGVLLGRGWWFDPDERVTRRFVTYIPEGRFDLLRLTADLNVAKADSRLEDKNIYWFSNAGRLTSLPSEISWEFERIYRPGADTTALSTMIHEKYGAAHTGSTTELSLWHKSN